MKGWETVDILHLFAHCSNVYDSQGWVRAKAGVQDWIQVSLSGVGTQVLDPSPAACQCVPWHKAKVKAFRLGHTSAGCWHPRQCLNLCVRPGPYPVIPLTVRAETDFLFFLKKKKIPCSHQWKFGRYQITWICLLFELISKNQKWHLTFRDSRYSQFYVDILNCKKR